MAKSALETKIKDIERDLKKETHEANQISAKLEQDLSKEKEIAQKHQQSLKNEIDSLKVEISEKSANFEMEKTVLETKLKEVEQDLLRKTESFDELIWSWVELEKFEEEKKIQSRNDERFEMGKSFKSILQNRAMQGISKWCL